MNEDTLVVVASAVKEVVTPFVVDMTVERKSEATEGGGNGIDVVVPVDSIRAISERFANIAYGGSSYARAMIKLRADVELKDNIVVAMPKITMEGHYTCNIRVEYEWKPPRCASCKVFGHIHEERPKNIRAGETKNLKKPGQTSRGVSVGLKVGFKPHKEYQPVSKKPTASFSGNKKKVVEPTIEVSTSNPFEVVNSVDNDVEDSYGNGDHDDDPYDDDMYEGRDISQVLQAICDNLDIRIRGRRKK
nr:hypothetical protein [Tanacetum cinerariifolium]